VRESAKPEVRYCSTSRRVTIDNQTMITSTTSNGGVRTLLKSISWSLLTQLIGLLIVPHTVILEPFNTTHRFAHCTSYGHLGAF